MVEAGPWAAVVVVVRTVCEALQGIGPWLWCVVVVLGLLGLLELLLTLAVGEGRLYSVPTMPPALLGPLATCPVSFFVSNNG